jgi:RNA polymerase sigma factor (sigma-70 family)
MQLVSDAELVTRSRRRDTAAFGSLVERHQDLVFGVALARCGDPELASDLVQDAFVAAWRNLDQLREHDRVGSWIAGIARNLAANATRARAREAKLAPEPATVPTPEDAALEREGRELIQRALADLPETHREVLVLHYFQAQSVAAIADGLAISEDLVKQRMSRGRRAVRDHISRLLDDGRLRMRPRAGLVASVVAALTIPTSEAVASTTAGKLIVMATASKKLAVGGAIALLFAGGGATYMATRPSTATPVIEAATPRATSASESKDDSRSGPAIRRISPAARAELLSKIREARSRRPRPSPSTSTAPSSTNAPALASSGQAMEEYVLAAFEEIMPLLKECYAEGLERIPGLPGGRITLDFRIEGEPGVGGVIGESTIAPESSITDRTVRECVQETINAVEIDPPQLGVTHQMRTTFEMRPDGKPASEIDQSVKWGPGGKPPADGVVVTE